MDSLIPPSGQRDHWPLMRRQFWFYAAMLSVSVMMTIATSLEFGSGARIDACGAAGMASVVTVFAVFSPTSVWRLLGWPRVEPKTAGLLLAGAALWGLGIEGYFFLIRALGVQFVQFWPDFDAAAWPWWAVFVIVCVVPGVFEEIAFRGLIYDGLRPILGPRDALLVEAMGFAVLHLAPLIFISHFFIGLGLGMLRDRTRGLLVPMFAHTAWNTYVIGSEWWATHHALIIP
jgi:membrane protease YdiL (CAAX protease family)